MKRKRFRIGTALKRAYSKTTRTFTKKARRSATMRAVKKTSKRMKTRLTTMVKKARNSVKRMTRKIDVSIAKKIRSITNRRR